MPTYLAAQVAYKRAHMRQPDPFSGLVLRAGTPEQIKYTLMVLGRNAAPIVGDIDGKTRRPGSCGAVKHDAQRTSLARYLTALSRRLPNLVERQAVGDDGGRSTSIVISPSVSLT
jgi:hypothetical protein